MAGTFTHFIICDVAKKEKNLADSELKRLLNEYSEFLFLGAASPDLPYLSFKTGSVNWADLMHYEKTNDIVANGFDELKKVWAMRQDADEIKFIWLLGFVSHLIADASIHPIVQAIVGPYEQNKEQHRICEMTQDSLIYNEFKNIDIRYAEFSSIIKFCSKSEYFDELMDFWKEQATDTYYEKNEKPNPKLWFTTYSEAIDIAEGGSDIIALFRHIGIGSGYIYRTKNEIISAYPKYYEKYFTKIKLPNGSVEFFIKYGFEKTVNNVIESWNKLYTGLSSPITVANIIKNWNLDTGVDLDSPEGIVTYWA